MIHSRDIINVSSGPDGGSTVTYDASLNTTGLAAPFGALLGPAFRRIGDRAAAGLRDALAK